ncbi:MAG TPA: hypothetical protein VFT01_11465 [Homoserinimonas sp.]|nr:hypothetical protein [Homoserinimonas sp.]
MTQVSWRAPEALVERVQKTAAAQRRSMNEFITQVLDIATSPDGEDPEEVRLRARLERAGILVVPLSWNDVVVSADDLSAARAEAGAGTPLGDLISDERR